MKSYFALITLLIMLSGCASIDPLAITPESKYATIVIDTDSKPIPALLVIAPYNETEKVKNKVPTGVGFLVGVNLNTYNPSGLLYKALDAGDYYIPELIMQQSWSACLNRSTFKFSVEPGKVYHFGKLDALSAYTEGQHRVKKNDDTRVLIKPGQIAKWYGDLESELKFTAPTDLDLEIAKANLTGLGENQDIYVQSISLEKISFVRGGDKNYIRKDKGCS